MGELSSPCSLADPAVVLRLQEVNAAIFATPVHNGTEGIAEVVLVSSYTDNGTRMLEGAYTSTGGKELLPVFDLCGSIVECLSGRWISDVDESEWQRKAPHVLEPVRALVEVLGSVNRLTMNSQWLAVLNRQAGLPPLAYCDGKLWEGPIESFAGSIIGIMQKPDARP